MLKRLSVLFFVLLIIVSCAVPAFGIGFGGGDSDVWYSYFPFDSVTVLGGYHSGAIFSWPYNEYTGLPAFFDFEDSESPEKIASGHIYGNGEELRGGFRVDDALGVELYAEFMFFNDDYSLTFTPSEETTGNFDRVRISFRVAVAEPDTPGGTYKLRYCYVEYDSLVDPMHKNGWGVLYFEQLIKRAYVFTQGASFPKQDIVLLEDVRFALWNDHDQYEFSIDIKADISLQRPYYSWLGVWFDRLNLDVPVGDFNYFDWLIKGIGGFMDFELLPNLSFGNLLKYIAIVGLMLWFFKMIK